MASFYAVRVLLVCGHGTNVMARDDGLVEQWRPASKAYRPGYRPNHRQVSRNPERLWCDVCCSNKEITK